MAAKAKALVQDTNLPTAIIVDMDATVCLNTSGRPFYGEGAAEGMLTDEPITPILELIRNFCDNYPAKLIILTGRKIPQKFVKLQNSGWRITSYIQI